MSNNLDSVIELANSKGYTGGDNELREAINQLLIEARLEEIDLVDGAYHHLIDMKSPLNVDELVRNRIKTITIDNPRTQNDLFRHIQYRKEILLQELKGMNNE